ncbi:MAG: hypothetical protein J5814_10100, partial [Bacteroidaceae bacterium]|nr:hypothetical protein [Bacteroidaceae bacterium]
MPRGQKKEAFDAKTRKKTRKSSKIAKKSHFKIFQNVDFSAKMPEKCPENPCFGTRFTPKNESSAELQRMPNNANRLVICILPPLITFILLQRYSDTVQKRLSCEPQKSGYLY